jgi:integrase
MGPQHDKGDRLRFIGKGAKTREVPIHPELRAKLPMIFSQETRAPNVTRLARVMRQHTGVAFRPHALRATFAHVLEEADVHHDVRASLLGHGSTVTMGYSGVSWRRKAHAIAKLDYSPLRSSTYGLSEPPAPLLT